MTILAIDFSRRGHRPGILGAGLALAAVCGFLGAAWEYLAATAENRDLTRQVEAASHSRQIAGAARPVPATLSEPAIAAINEAIAQLNLPWADLFAAIESELPKAVALLALEPDSRRQVLKIVAKARTPDDMLGFIAKLDAGQQFAEVTLLKYEVDGEDAGAAVRFVLQARWGGGR